MRLPQVSQCCANLQTRDDTIFIMDAQRCNRDFSDLNFQRQARKRRIEQWKLGNIVSIVATRIAVINEKLLSEGLNQSICKIDRKIVMQMDKTTTTSKVHNRKCNLSWREQNQNRKFRGNYDLGPGGTLFSSKAKKRQQEWKEETVECWNKTHGGEKKRILVRYRERDDR